MTDAAADPSEAGLWWLSFVDTTRSAPLAEQVPGGGGFLGVVVIEASSFNAAIAKAHLLGINPGGEVAGHGPFALWEIGPQWRDRLLTSAEIDAMPCCDLHGDNCEAPADLCCRHCAGAERVSEAS